MTIAIVNLTAKHGLLLARLLESHPGGVDGFALTRVGSRMGIVGQWLLDDLRALELVEYCAEEHIYTLTAAGVLAAEQLGVES